MTRSRAGDGAPIPSSHKPLQSQEYTAVTRRFTVAATLRGAWRCRAAPRALAASALTVAAAARRYADHGGGPHARPGRRAARPAVGAAANARSRRGRRSPSRARSRACTQLATAAEVAVEAYDEARVQQARRPSAQSPPRSSSWTPPARGSATRAAASWPVRRRRRTRRRPVVPSTLLLDSRRAGRDALPAVARSTRSADLNVTCCRR